MAIGLGIDTGGTYTDGVLYDFDHNAVLASAKRLTTPQDLSIGVNALLDALPGENLTDVKLVSLSTTLATNACVEGRGGRVALILMGYDERLVSRLAEEYGLTHAGSIHVLAGSHTQWGEVREQPDLEGLQRVCEQVKDEVDAIGIVEYWGIRNPEYEQQAKHLARQWTNLPVTAAHELTNELNSMRRAATTLLNARLIPLIDELMEAVKQAIARKGMTAPLMIVRGDGSLMTERFARECPVETLLSGPASSATGALHLSGEEDMLMLDVGGTTTDLAIARGGRMQISRNGVDVGEWRTGTHAIAIRTIGLGGDSAIQFDKHGALTLGPRRALPLCVLAAEHPEIKRTLEALYKQKRATTYYRGIFFVKRREAPQHVTLTEEERAILVALEGGPLTVEELSQAIGTRPYFLKTELLESLGLVLRSMCTPTDIMHLRGEFSAFDKQASRLGMQLLGWQMGANPEALAQRVLDMASERVYRMVANFLMERWLGKKVEEPKSLGLGYENNSGEIDVRFDAKLPLVGIGAPAHVMLKEAAKRLHARLILPKEHGVANAIGAITGSVVVEETVLVQPIYDALGIKGYSAFSSENFYNCEELKQARAWAEAEAVRIVENRANLMGAQNPVIETEDAEQSTDSPMGALMLEMRIVARAVGGLRDL